MDSIEDRPILQVLVATMGDADHSLLERMNIQTPALVGNQCDFDRIDRFTWRNNSVVYFNFSEKGVGLNRNNTLMRATARYCLFADDDVVYDDGYESLIVDAFRENPDADVLVFNLREKEQRRYVIRKTARVRRWNYMRYGTVRIAIKLDSIRFEGIYFNELFGGGAPYSHGEDTLFLSACLDRGLKIVAIPQFIGTLVEERESTWEVGYGEKYLIDQGLLYRCVSRRYWRLLCLQDVVRHSSLYGINPFDAYRIMTSQASGFSGW